MANLFVCPVEGAAFPEVDDFLEHATVHHDHRATDDECHCPCCHPENV